MSTEEAKEKKDVQSPQEAPETPQKPEKEEPKVEVSEDQQEAAEANEEATKGQQEENVASNVSQADIPAPADEETAKRIGVKEAAQNEDVMSMEKKESEGSEEEMPVALPSFFIDPDKRNKVEVDVLCSKKDGQVLSVSRTGIGIDFDEFEYLSHFKEWFEFTLPSYEEMSSYRQRSGVYRKEAQSVIIDRLQLRNFLLVWHLKDWSLRDADGNKVELTHDVNGSLSDESIKVVYRTHTTILDVVLTIFEKDILLT